MDEIEAIKERLDAIEAKLNQLIEAAQNHTHSYRVDACEEGCCHHDEEGNESKQLSKIEPL